MKFKKLILEIQQLEFHIDIDITRQPDLFDITNFYQTGKGNFWIARSQNAVFGTIALLDIGDHQAALRKMFVDKNLRAGNGEFLKNCCSLYWFGRSTRE